MPLSQSEQSFALYLISSALVGTIYRVFRIKKYCQYVFALVGLIQIILFCGFDVLHFVCMVTVATWMIKSPLITNPKAVFTFCLTYRVFFSTSPHLGFYRNESNLANSLMLVATLKMIMVAYEVYDYRMKKKELPADEKYKWSGFGTLDTEPKVMDILCYMSCFAGLFTGPIYKYKTFHDMVNSAYKPVQEHIKSHAVKLAASFGILSICFVLLDLKYFAGNQFLEDGIFVRLLHVLPVGFFFQLRYVVVWLLGEVVCMLIGLGMYSDKSCPNPGKGPTLPEEDKSGTSYNAEESTQYNYNTIVNIKPMTVVADVSFWKTLRHWNCCVQWWLAQFIYRSNVFPSHSKIMRAVSTLLFSALWHGIKPGYFICFMPLPYFAFLEECCFYLQKHYIHGKYIKYMLRIFQWALLKLFCFASFFISFMLLDYKAIWKFLQYTYFACYLMPVIVLVTNGVVAMLYALSRFTAKKSI